MLGPALRGQVDAVIVAADGTVRVQLAAGFAATFGDATELDAKAVSLAALLGWMRREGVTIVSADVTVPGSPAARTRLAGGPRPLIGLSRAQTRSRAESLTS